MRAVQSVRNEEASGAGIIRAYLFDYGGTLDGEGSHWFDRFVGLYRKLGATFPRSAIHEAFYFADREIVTDAAGKGYRLRPLMERHVELQMEILGDEARRLAGPLVDGFCRITTDGWAHARSALGRLRERARLGVVSNFYGNLEVLLDEADLAPLFEVVVESAKVGVEKPDPKIYLLALERLRLPAGDVMMVGDNFERDVRVAKSVGMRTAWLRRGDAAPPQAGLAARVIGRLGELAER